MGTPIENDARKLRSDVEMLAGQAVARDLVIHELLVVALRDGTVTPESIMSLRAVTPMLEEKSAEFITAAGSHLAALVDLALEAAERDGPAPTLDR